MPLPCFDVPICDCYVWRSLRSLVEVLEAWRPCALVA